MAAILGQFPANFRFSGVRTLYKVDGVAPLSANPLSVKLLHYAQ